jgi:hypothetical protein
MNDVLVKQKTTIVVVSAELESTGEIIEQEYPIPHPSTAIDQAIVNQGLMIFKSMAGILRDTEDGGLEFIMASKFKSFKFKTKNIVLAGEGLINP